jgi:hypothetical protein
MMLFSGSESDIEWNKKGRAGSPINETSQNWLFLLLGGLLLGFR